MKHPQPAPLPDGIELHAVMPPDLFEPVRGVYNVTGAHRAEVV